MLRALLTRMVIADHIDAEMTSREAREKVEDELNRNGVEIRDIFVIRGKSYRPESPERRKEFADRITKYLKKAMGRQNLIYGRSEIDGYSLNEENGSPALPFTVNVLPVTDARDYEMMAEVVFDSFENFDRITAVFVNEMTNHIPLSMGLDNNKRTVSFHLKLFLHPH
ncbi:unnamed protein product [Enterobius vermicularis]|uniref:AKAP7_NLS domain-containing protein n=1 Tax=Enterobius vermicularis TaxID=51028 RepID=A0A0N4UT16_ENTVE|nr:unnamed protein product [Enterobius vermicularis]